MWQPRELILENFRSFKEQTFEFKKGAFLIQGINNTDDGSESNGSGKSSLREALCFVLGLPTFSDTNTDLINNNADKCKVEFHLFNSLTKDDLLIIRELPLKGSSMVTIILNGIDQKDQFATVRDGDKLIIDLIGISKEDLLNHYIVSKEKFTSFFSSSDTKIKELISRFSNFNKFDGVEDIVQIDIDFLNEELKILNDGLQKYEGKIEYLKEELIKEKEKDVEEEISSQISKINGEISNYIKSIEDARETIQNKKNKIFELKGRIPIHEAKKETLEKELKSLQEIKFDDEIKQIEKKKEKAVEQKDIINQEIYSIETQLKEFNKFKIEIETAIEGSIQCPKCFHEFIPNNEISIEEAKKTLPTVLKEIEEFNTNIKNNSSKISKIQEILSKLNENLSSYEQKISDFNKHKNNLLNKIDDCDTEIYNISRSISNITGEISSIEDRIVHYNKMIEQKKQSIEEIKKQEVKTKEEEINKSIDSLIEEKSKHELKIEEKKDQIFEKEQWVFRFKKFRSKLANESLDIIQGYANMYLENMKTNLNVKIEGFRQNRDGSIREKINPIVLRNGIQEGSGNFKKYSGGERGKIDIATSVLAVQTLINNSCHTGGLNLTFIDEVLESVDSQGLECIVESVDNPNTHFMVISHVRHDKVHNNVITVEKTNNVSKII